MHINQYIINDITFYYLVYMERIALVLTTKLYNTNCIYSPTI